jgi:hypothetical protein
MRIRITVRFAEGTKEITCIKNYDVFRASNNDLVAIPGELDGMYPFIDVKLSVRSQRCGICGEEHESLPFPMGRTR